MSTENTELNTARDRAIVECLRIFARHGRKIRQQQMLEMNASLDKSMASRKGNQPIESETNVFEYTDGECPS